MITLTLSADDVNAWLRHIPDAEVDFQAGCFEIYKKLKVRWIRGDISKGLAQQVARGI